MRYELLNDSLEWEIVKQIDLFEGVVNEAREKLEPHLICRYVLSLAALFNSYYSKVNIKLSDDEHKRVRLFLLGKLQKTILEAMELVGLQAVERM